MVIKIKNQINHTVENKLLLVKNIKDRVKLGLKEAKDLVDCLDGDQSYVIPTSFTREDRIELYNVLAEAGLEPEWCKDEDVIDFEDDDDDPDRIGAYVEATEVGIIVTVRMRIDKKVSKQFVNLLKDAGMVSAKNEPSVKEPNQADIVSVGNNFGLGEVCACNIQTYINNVLRFKEAVGIEYRLREIIDQVGIKRTLEEYKRSL